MKIDIEKSFTYHPPKPGQPALYENVRNNAKQLAHVVNLHCPDSREKSLAITKLEESVMWANAAIARSGEANAAPPKGPEPVDYETYIMRLAAISTASLHNTEDSRKDRITRESPYWTVAYRDVCDAVDREIRWRDACEKARAELDEFIENHSNRNDVPQAILDARSHLAEWRFV